MPTPPQSFKQSSKQMIIGLLVLCGSVFLVLYLNDFSENQLWLAGIALFALFCSGCCSLFGSEQSRHGRAMAAALRGTQPKDGHLTAITGTLQPLLEPLTAPLSDLPCVLFNYELFDKVRQKRGKNWVTVKRIHYAGVGYTPYVIRASETLFPAYGLPGRSFITQVEVGGRCKEAERLIQTTEYEETKKNLDLQAWMQSLNLAKRLVQTPVTRFVRRNDATPDITKLTLQEHIVPIGVEVTAIGRFREVDNSLLPETNSDHSPTFYPGDMTRHASELSQQGPRYFQGGLVGATLSVIALVYINFRVD